MTARTPVPPALRITLVEDILDRLPQTQCGKCQHPGCRPYAEAMARGEAINHCVPGGQPTIEALAELLGEVPLPLDPTYGVTPATRQVARIREAECIGCTKCIQACPVDAIVGAAKLMHTVLEDECTGCDLCIAPCPVDCIDLVDLPSVPDAAERRERSLRARRRYEARNARLAREAALRRAARPVTTAVPPPVVAPASGVADKSKVIAAALARSNLKKAERKLAQALAAGADPTAAAAEVAAAEAALAALARDD